MNKLDLNGTWKLLWHEEQRSRVKCALQEEVALERYLDAQVPGEVHLDLMRAGWIDDPLTGMNCLKSRWVEEMLWSYRREFDLPAEALNMAAWLAFEGLDLVAEIYLNGEKVGTHDNRFYPCRVDVTGKLRAGRNWMVVVLDSGLWWAADKKDPGVKSYALNKAHWLRKPYGEFTMDWSPQLLNVGIFKPVRLEWTPLPARVDQLVAVAEVSPDLTQGTVRVRQFIEGLEGAENARALVSVELAGTGICKEQAFPLKKGLMPYELKLDVPDPDLWWPVGVGPQSLYSLRVSVSINDQPQGESVRQIGFRRTQFNQSRRPDSGREFFLEINNRRVFCKGSNLMQADLISARANREVYAKLVDRALEANFNYLRVWGGGLYESDEFYELCDAKGLLVWQEFSFCGHPRPSFNEALRGTIIREATWNVRRLASHPSLIAWCGNNEMEGGAAGWNSLMQPGMWNMGCEHNDYDLYHLAFPKILKAEDGSRYYQPSSPYSPDMEPPQADHCGDQHPWDVGFKDMDFRKYRTWTCRFPQEGGMLGPRALPTMMACLGEEPMRRIDSLTWRLHDNSVDGWYAPSTVDAITEFWLGKKPQEMTIEAYTYWGGLLQAEALSEYIANFRHRMFDSGGLVFWMFNDCWPCTRSWAIVDNYQRRAPSFYAVRRSFQPVTVVVADENTEVVVYGVNDTNAEVSGDLRFGVFTLAGEYPLDTHRAVVLPPNASTRVASFPKSKWTNPANSAAFASLADARGALLARHRLFLPLFKDLEWAPMQVTTHLEDNDVVFESSTFVWGICLDLNGDNSLPDNLFDLYPRVPYRLPWHHPTPPTIRYLGDMAARTSTKNNEMAQMAQMAQT